MKECEPLVSAREPPGPRAPRRRTVLCIAGIAATALGARRVLAPSVTSVSALAASAIDDDVFRVGNHSVFWRATHNGTTTRWAQRQNATYRAVATSNASSNASAGDEVFYNGIYVTELVSVLNNPPYSTDDFWCDIDFAYCGRASCTRHAKDKHGKAGVEVAACSCEPVASGSGNYAKLELADLPALSLLAQSSEFVEVMRNYVEGYHSYDETRALLCDGLSGGRFLSKLAPRSISLPASDADAFGAVSSSSYSYSYDAVVDVHRCEHNVAIAVCSGAPCYDDDKTTTKGHLTRTCLCPVYPYSGFESFKLTAPDVGHMHGCRAYAYADGDCARQATSSGLEGSLLQKWSAAAVDSMSTAPHHTDIGYCRDWFES